MTEPGSNRARRALGLAFAAAVVVVLILLLRGGSSYTVNAVFRDAGQLIKGDLVEVGGLPVGKISDLKLTSDNNADVVLNITDSRFIPLHSGTTAGISTVGLAGIANRFVSVNPGPSNTPVIRDGGALDETGTKPIVDLDELLNSLKQPVLRDLQTLFVQGTVAFQSTVAGSQLFHYSNPAFSQLQAVTGQVVADRHAFSALISSGASVASTLAAHTGELTGLVSSTARALRAVAGQRTALADAIARAPGVLTHATGTLSSLRTTLASVNPTLLAAQPVAAPLAALLRAAVPAGRDATPVLTHLLHTLPATETALSGLPALRDSATPVLSTLTRTLQLLLPIATGLRPYTPDVINGLLRGLSGSSLGSYDANGHYATVNAATGAGGAGAPVVNQLIDSLLGFVPTLNGFRTGLTNRCPGSAGPPAADNSNPWVADPSLCNPAHSATPDH
jgi:phospholipid/cholesterol/gamma-HCH transport system substrate-binding protein